MTASLLAIYRGEGVGLVVYGLRVAARKTIHTFDQASLGRSSLPPAASFPAAFSVAKGVGGFCSAACLTGAMGTTTIEECLKGTLRQAFSPAHFHLFPFTELWWASSCSLHAVPALPPGQAGMTPSLPCPQSERKGVSFITRRVLLLIGLYKTHL